VAWIDESAVETHTIKGVGHHHKTFILLSAGFVGPVR